MATGSPSRSFQLLFWGGLVLAWILNATLLETPEPDQDSPTLHKSGPGAPPKAKSTSPQKAESQKVISAQEKAGEDKSAAAPASEPTPTLPKSGAGPHPNAKSASPQAVESQKVISAQDKAGEDKFAVAPASEPAPPPICATNQKLVVGGTFQMGSSDGEEDEAPVHEVTLSEFCIDKTEVTVAEYRQCVEAGACSAGFKTAQRAGYGFGHWNQRNRFCHWASGPEMDQHPMNCVDWKQATAYCAWTGGRLPTEAEWEYAARGETGHRYPWGDEAPSPAVANACGDECVAMAKKLLGETWARTFKGDDGWPTTAPVGSFPKGASPFGVLDMAGNVWEWTADSYSRYSRESVRDPHHSTGENSPRVCRGGGWSNFLPARIATTQRYWHLTDTRIGDLGFRCAR